VLFKAHLLADEEEIFDSDFASTDEDEGHEDVEEQAIQAEERREHRVCIHVQLYHTCS
jgi:hypothetical protein